MEIVDLLEYSERAQLRKWFEQYAASQKCCWIAMYRGKNKPEGVCLPYLDVVEEALCFGWIDSTLKRLPDGRLAQRLSPRQERSHWTELNKQRCADLEARGLMTNLGRATLQKANGSVLIRTLLCMLWMACTVLIFTSCTNKTDNNMATIYDFKVLSNRGKEVNLADYQGQVILIVNTASKCGFTPQYDGLEELYKKYKDQGFVILGFPCDQFANQEPGSDEQIEEFCRLNHGVTFPLMAKSDVNGTNANPVFEYLKTQAPTEEYKGLKAKAAHAMLKRISKSVEKESDILWNFTKFLVSRDGKTIQRFAPVVEPKDFEQDIEAML